MTTLKQRVAKKLGVNESELIWSEYSTNPETIYKSDIGTVRGKLGYYVVK